MPKLLTPAMRAHLDEETTRLTAIWRITRKDTDLLFQTDTTSALQVTMVSGSLASVSNFEMLNGANLAALIRADGNAEFIQFQDIALAEGVYTLTTLLRGRRGTELRSAMSVSRRRAGPQGRGS